MSIPGGGRSALDADPWATATRETREEFGVIPDGAIKRFDVSYPFAPLFSWRTFAVQLPQKPESGTFPDETARDFRHEFTAAAWHDIRRLPRKTHWLLYPVIWKIIRRKTAP